MARRWIIRGGLVLGAILLSAGLAEVSFRVFLWCRSPRDGIQRSFRPEPDPHVHHRNATDCRIRHQSDEFNVAYILNDQGFRAARHYGPKSAGRLRCLMLGDSFTFGIGVEDQDTFSARIEQALHEDAHDVEVVNAGVLSYSPLLYYVSLRDRYGGLAPDLVMLWFDFSDLQDDFNQARHVIVDAQGRIVACHPDILDGHVDWMGAILRRSDLAAYLYGKLDHLQGCLAKSWKPAGSAPPRTVFSTRPDIIEEDRYAFIRPSVPAEALEQSWARTSGFLVNIRDLLRERGIPLILVLYPYGVQVGPDQWAQGRVHFSFEPGRVYDDPRPFALIEAFAAAHQIPVINTVQAFRAARGQQLFFDRDGHFTPAGHQVAADAVLRHPVFRHVVDRFESWHRHASNE